MGGHGGLNILPQKSWNVYNFDNREKVRKDEEEHAQKLAEEREKQLQHDAEARRTFLLDRARQKRSESKGAVCNSINELEMTPVAESVNMHINLFEGMVELGAAEGGIVHTNSRKAITAGSKELQVEDIRYSLGYGSADTPWYAQMGPIEGDKARLLDDRAGSKKEFLKKKRERTAVDASKNKKRKSVEELRQERVQREQKERERSKKVLVVERPSGISATGLAVAGGRTFKAPMARPPRYTSGFGYGK